MKNIWLNNTRYGSLDLNTHTIYLPFTKEYMGRPNDVLAHELVHFIQMTTTRFGILHENLINNIHLSYHYLLAVLSENKIQLKFPLYKYIQDIGLGNKCKDRRLIKYYNLLYNNMKALERLFGSQQTIDIKLDNIISLKIEIDVEKCAFILNDSTILKISPRFILESMSFAIDLIDRIDSPSKMTVNIPVDCPEYWLALGYLEYSTSSSPGSIFFLCLCCWYCLLFGPEQQIDELGYFTGYDINFNDIYTKLFLKMLKMGKFFCELFKQAASNGNDPNEKMVPIFEELLKRSGYKTSLNYLIKNTKNELMQIYNFLLMIRGNENRDSKKENTIDGKTKQGINYLNNDKKIFMKSNKISINLVNYYIADLFYKSVSEYEQILFAPFLIFSDDNLPRPIIFYKDSVTWPTCLGKEIWEHRQGRILSSNILWNSSLECYDRKFALDFNTRTHFWPDCPDRLFCKFIVGKTGIQFCKSASYRNYVMQKIKNDIMLTETMMKNQVSYWNKNRKT